MEGNAIKDQTAIPILAMSENILRPDFLAGSTYKVKNPHLEHAMYITINDVILNEGTDSEERRPFEIFINSKNMDNFQWVVALTRLLSAIFRKGGDILFIVEELKAIFDPKGGYFEGGNYVESTVAGIGLIVEKHLAMIGLLEVEAEQ